MLLPNVPSSLLPLVARGCRIFRSGGAGADRLLTLPGRAGAVVLVPRGHGAPVLAREAGAQFVSVSTGLVCTPVRWAPAGAVAAVLREASAPRPCAPVAAVPLRADGVTVLRVHRLAATAARVSDGAPAAVVKGRRVVAVNARAAARGVGAGMLVRRALALCPGLRVHQPGDEQQRLVELGEWLTAEYGACVRVRGGFQLPAVPAGDDAAVLTALSDLRTRVWQATGLTVKAVSAPNAAAAGRLSRHLAGHWVASISAASAGLWAARLPLVRLHRSAAAGCWSGESMLDVEGVVSLAQALTAGARGAVRLRLWSDKGVLSAELSIPAAAGKAEVASRVEVAVRRALGGGVAVWALRWDAECVAAAVVAAPRQVALWA